MKLTIVLENVKDGTKKTVLGMFVTYNDGKNKPVHATSLIPKGDAFGDELEGLIDQMKQLQKEQKKK